MFKLDQSISIHFLTDLASACYTEPRVPLTQVRDAISMGQIKSKLWLIDRLSGLIDHNEKHNILIVGGWIGTLSRLMLDLPQMSNYIERIISLDINPVCEKFADTLNLPYVIDNWKFKAITEDMFNIDYQLSKFNIDGTFINFDYDVLINTSCEHIENFEVWLNKIPKGKMVVLQSNNYDIPEHINKVNSLEEFKEQCNQLSEVLYCGSLNCDVYIRYMIIGIK